jgi:hypothetical protein
MAKQIESKYIDESYLHAGESVGLWVVAPYVEASHTGDSREMSIARHREIEAATLLNQAGFGYLHSWHPVSHIAYDSHSRAEAFGRFDPYVPAVDIPGLNGDINPQKASGLGEYEIEQTADYARLQRSSEDAFAQDRDKRHEIWEKYHGGDS